ncbi:MAG: bifunctional demethylmenaquinone methyltransferase/2-methoxy-6-polyprenyl-1,4-benzoquinol methylase UbiE [Prochlorotrichaceae cyanobacterium]
MIDPAVTAFNQDGVDAHQVQSLFNRIAPNYDRFNDQFSLGLHRVWKLMTVKWVNPQPGGCYLDLCCGSGDLAFLLAERAGHQGKVYGVDFAEDLLTIAAQRSRQYLPHKDLSNNFGNHAQPSPQASIIWQVGDALNLHFPDRFFDGITVGYGFRNWSNFHQGLQELKRVLKPGAKAALLDFHRPTQPWLAMFQRWFLENQVVTSAANLGLQSEYAYILPSLDRFPQGFEQIQLAQQVGFREAIHYPLLGGLMGVLVVQC